jgi:pimeloyl-ACP methyl ester carboxylesterase
VLGLQDAGYRVVRYDIFGRGFSDRIKGPYNLDTYIRQLHQLTAHLGIEQFRVVGSSMGAIIASQYANSYPDHVDQLVLIGPAGFPIEVPWLAKLRDVPIVGQFTFSVFGESIIFEQNKKYFVHPERYSEFLKFFAKQLNVVGTSDAILSTMRNVPVTDFESGYQNLASKSKPVAVIWGREDATFPYHNYNLLKEWIPHAQMLTIDDAAHLPQYEQPQEVLDAMLNFFAGNEKWSEDLSLNQKGEINSVMEIEPIDNGDLFDSEFFQNFDDLATDTTRSKGSRPTMR